MLVSDVIQESFTDWGNDWVHYTDHPMLAISPNQFHQDPAGIYFFPAAIKPKANMWHERKYRFIVQLKPGTRVLDISTITDQQINQIVHAAGPDVVDKFNAYITQYPPQDITKKFRMAWERIRAFYAFEGGKVRQYSSFNSMLRRLGWDAIFDDTGSIHSGEPEQLLVLNPRVLTNIRMEPQTNSSYGALQKVYNDVLSIAEKYGAVEATGIKKPGRNSYFADQDKLLLGNIRVVNPTDENNYASVYFFVNKDKPFIATAELRYTSPSRHYTGAAFHIRRGEYDEWYSLERFERELASVFDNARVNETKKLPGPKVVGSGKDFRQNAGVNRSGKQPGRLMGSGKPMKVKPGFVG